MLLVTSKQDNWDLREERLCALRAAIRGARAPGFILH